MIRTSERRTRHVPAAWRGIRLTRLDARPDPDASAESVIVPAGWDPAGAEGFAALRRSARQESVIAAASAWIDPIAEAALAAGMPDAGAIAADLHRALSLRRAAPSASIWQGETDADSPPGFVINLARFHDAETGFDIAGFAATVDLAVRSLALARPDAPALAIGMADLALLLARLGLDYGSQEARAVAACLAGMLAATADAASARRFAGAMAPGHPIAPRHRIALPPLPERCAIPGLAEAAGAARQQAESLGWRHHRAVTGILPPGPVEALLGVTTIGIAAPFSSLDAEGSLARWAADRLAASGRTAEQALAQALAGADPFGVPDRIARLAMREAVAPFFAIMSDAQADLPLARPAVAYERLPARRNGYTQKASIGGHKVFLRTGEYPDGRLGEVSIGLTRESAAFRALMEAFGTAVGIGLQHGVPLDAFVDAFAFTRFGAAGKVEGDAAIAEATSVLDYVMRHLAITYLDRQDLATVESAAVAAPEPQSDAPPREEGELPLELPSTPPRLGRPVLKLVG